MTPATITKINYTLNLGRINKVEAIQTHGVGENIDNVVLGWMGERLVAVCSLAPKMELQEKFHAAFMATATLRRGYGADSVTLLADGWWSNTETEVAIAQRFADGDKDVDEALLVHYISPEEDAVIVAQPYLVGLGRKVSMHKPHSQRLLSDDIGGVAALKRALTAELGEALTEADLRKIGVTVEVVE